VSRLALLVRQLCMERGGTSARRWLTVPISHGFARDQAEVPLSCAANLNLFIVILAKYSTVRHCHAHMFRHAS
jgi:hypothetical protein